MTADTTAAPIKRKPKATAQPAETSLVLRTCAADMSSHSGFVWPGAGETATAPDWQATPECGNGLHGWLYGAGDHSLSSSLDEKAKWLVIEVESASIIMLGGKCKFPRGVVRFVGDRKSAADYLIANEPRAAGCAVIGAVLAVGDAQAAIVGACGSATAGDRGSATAGACGSATAGDRGSATAGDSGSATAGDSGSAIAGYRGSATAGDSGSAIAGVGGSATAGDSGSAAAGVGGSAAAGDRGSATAGAYGSATAGYRGEIRIRYYDSDADRYRTQIGYVGEGGIEPNVAYQLNSKHEFIRAA